VKHNRDFCAAHLDLTTCGLILIIACILPAVTSHQWVLTGANMAIPMVAAAGVDVRRLTVVDVRSEVRL
jgi:hypothetical protein